MGDGAHRRAGLGTVTSYTPSSEGGREIDNQNLVCFHWWGGRGRVRELAIRQTIHHPLISCSSIGSALI